MSPKLLNLLLLIASGAVYYLVIGPIYTGESSGVWAPERSIKTLIQEKKDLEKTIETIRPTIEEAKKLQAFYEGIDQETKDKLAIMVPESVNDIKFYVELNRIASDAGLPVEFSTKDTGTGYTISLSVTTNYEGFKRFITYYERSMRLFTLENITFSPSPKDDEVKFSISLATYYLGK